MNAKLKFYILVIAAIVELCLIGAMLYKHNFKLSWNDQFPSPLLFNSLVFVALAVNAFKMRRKMSNN